MRGRVLVVRRHPGEAIQIGEDVEIRIIECGPGRVKLGVIAPQSVAVVRGEARLTREQNLAAARTLQNRRYGVLELEPCKLSTQASLGSADT